MFKKEKSAFSARDIIVLFADIKYLLSDEDSWNKDDHIDNPPRYIRLSMLDALLPEFNLGSPESFSRGEFITSTFDVTRIQNMYSKYLKQPDSVFGKNELDSYFVAKAFSHLLEYKIALWGLFRHNDYARLATHPLGEVPVTMIDSVNFWIEGLQLDVDRFLQICISPDNRTCSKELLMKRYDFPDVDLNAIDIEYL